MIPVLCWHGSGQIQENIDNTLLSAKGKILEETKVDEWRWVPTSCNVADEATKWDKGPNLEPTSRWYNGEEFLYYSEKDWPWQKQHNSGTIEELRPVNVHREVTPQPIIDFTRFSKWERLLRTVAHLFHFIDSCRGQQTQSNGGLLSQAEHALWRVAQSDTYPNEVAVLSQRNDNSRQVEKNSPIHVLSPFMDDFAVIRMRGRIEKSSIAAYDTKYPIILPLKHRITELLVDKFHRMFCHGNGESVVNDSITITVATGATS